MFVDASVIIAILTREPQAEACQRALLAGDDGRDVTLELLDQWQREEVAAMGGSASVARAAALLTRATHDDAFVEFITLPAYEEIVRDGS